MRSGVCLELLAWTHGWLMHTHCLNSYGPVHMACSMCHSGHSMTALSLGFFTFTLTRHPHPILTPCMCSTCASYYQRAVLIANAACVCCVCHVVPTVDRQILIGITC